MAIVIGSDNSTAVPRDKEDAMDEVNARVAVIMAASRGLGRACALRLAEEGWSIAVCSRTREGVDATIAAARELGADASGVVADVSTASGIDSLFAHVDGKHGRLDALVCNAGGPPPGGFDNLDDGAWLKGYELTLMSAVRAIRAAIPRMRETGYGRLIVLGSSSVRRPIPGLALSNAYRPALAGIVKSLAVELGLHGITANMVSPGRIDTARVRSLDAAAAKRQAVSVDEVRAASERAIPFGRYGEPEELAAMVAFLASESASYVTGQSLLVDGGFMPTLP